MPIRVYTIKEIFYSIQGEGYHAGSPAIFIRFAGCNLNCSFCDTDYSGGDSISLGNIIDEIFKLMSTYSTPDDFFLNGMIILTGGEPTLQIDTEFLRAIRAYCDYIAIETNGTKSINELREEFADLIDWYTVSPKSTGEGKEFLPSCGDELKVLMPTDFTRDYMSQLDGLNFDHFYIQPLHELDEKQYENNVEDCIYFCKAHPKWNLSLQQHKFVNDLFGKFLIR